MPAPHTPPQHALTPALSFLLATACGLIVANLYYAQPLIGPIADDLGLPREAAGFIVTLAQVGYGLGLLFIVPLADRLENRRLITISLLLTTLALFVAGFSGSAASFLAASLVMGFGGVAAQVIVPFASHLAPEAERGRAVGNVMSGLLLGIMLARPMASFIADRWGWHAIFIASAVAMLLMTTALRLRLPVRRPASTSSYPALLRSMGRLWLETPVLRLRGTYHAFAFAAFSLFWTAAPLQLAQGYGLDQTGIGLFALAGVAGAVAAPIAGRLADRGWSHLLTPFAMLAMVGAFGIALLAPMPGLPGVLLLTLAAIVLDMGVAASLLLGQRVIFGLDPQARGRLNGLFIAMFFAGGAIGSSLGAWSYAHHGWTATLAVGLGLPLLSFLIYLGARARQRRGGVAAA